jgi:hypothetical protein
LIITQDKLIQFLVLWLATTMHNRVDPKLQIPLILLETINCVVALGKLAQRYLFVDASTRLNRRS